MAIVIDVDSNIRSLLELQEIDIRKLRAEETLAHIPLEISALHKKIKAVEDEENAEKESLKGLELQRSLADKELKAAEDKIVTLKTKQMDVKKNEEYQALNQEISHQESIIGQLEDKELMLLEQIDLQKNAFQKKVPEFKLRIGELQGQIRHLEKQKSEIEGILPEIKEAVRKASEGIAVAYLRKYEQLRQESKRGLYVVGLQEQRCQGCHLKVSNEVLTDVKKGLGPVQCDSCSRILYVAA